MVELSACCVRALFTYLVGKSRSFAPAPVMRQKARLAETFISATTKVLRSAAGFSVVPSA
jgi:hypothetical protein